MRFEYYALLTAFCFGLNAVLVRKGMAHSNAVTATLLVSGVQVSVLGSLLILDPPKINPRAAAYFVAAGFLAAILGRTLNYLSIDRVGVPVSTSLTGTNPLFALLLSALLLGEALTLFKTLGVVMVVVGVALVSGGGGGKPLRVRDLAAPLASAFFYALSSVVRKAGLTLQPEPVLGAVLGTLTSLVAYPLILRVMGRAGEFKPTRASAPWFIAGGVATSVAWLAMFTATQEGPVGVVSAIIGANPLFGLLLSALLLRDVERVTARVALGSALIVAGVAVITLF